MTRLRELEVVAGERVPGAVAEPDRTEQPAAGSQGEDRQAVDAHLIQGPVAVAVREQRAQHLSGLRPADQGPAGPEGLAHLPDLFEIPGDALGQALQGGHLCGIDVGGADDGSRVGGRLDQPDHAPVGDARNCHARQLGERGVQPQGARQGAAQAIEEPQPFLVAFGRRRQAGPIERQRALRGDALEQLGVIALQVALVLEPHSQRPERAAGGVVQRNDTEGIGEEHLGRIELRIAAPALGGGRDGDRPTGPHHLGGRQRRTPGDAPEACVQDVFGNTRSARDHQLVVVRQHVHHAPGSPEQWDALVEHRPHDLVGMAEPVESLDQPGRPRRGADGPGGVHQHPRRARALCPAERLDPHHGPALAGPQSQRFLACPSPGLTSKDRADRLGGRGPVVGMEQLQPPIGKERILVGLRVGRAVRSRAFRHLPPPSHVRSTASAPEGSRGRSSPSATAGVGLSTASTRAESVGGPAPAPRGSPGSVTGSVARPTPSLGGTWGSGWTVMRSSKSPTNGRSPHQGSVRCTDSSSETAMCATDLAPWPRPASRPGDRRARH